MKHERIATQSATPWAPRARDLFGVETWTECKTRRNDKARIATPAECKAYLIDIAERAGLPMLGEIDICGQRMTVGRQTRQAGGEYVDVLDWETLTTRREYVRYDAEYEAGSYSVWMPGSNQRQVVTMEILDDAGEVISASTMPVEPKKCGVVWDRADVREAVGKVAKPVKAPRATKAEKHDNLSTVVESVPVAAKIRASDDLVAQLLAEIRGLSNRVESLVAEVAELRAVTNVARNTEQPSLTAAARNPAQRKRVAIRLRDHRQAKVDLAQAVERSGRYSRIADDNARLAYEAEKRADGLAKELAEARRATRIANMRYAPAVVRVNLPQAVLQ